MRKNKTISLGDLKQTTPFSNIIAKSKLRDEETPGLEIEIPPFTYSRQDIIYALLDADLIYITCVQCRRNECIDIYFCFVDWFDEYNLVFYESPNFKKEALPEYSVYRFLSCPVPSKGEGTSGFKHTCLFEFERPDIQDAIKYWYNSVVNYLNRAKEQYSFKYELENDTIDLAALDTAREEIRCFNRRILDVSERQDGHPSMVSSYYTYYLQEYSRFDDNSITYGKYRQSINDLAHWSLNFDVMLEENKGP